jgi:DnaJ-class molecular chaperone
MNHYQTLQVDRAASPEVIDAAYRRLAKIFHPDVNTSPDASQKMRDINEAHSVLRDPSKRSAYD